MVLWACDPNNTHRRHRLTRTFVLGYDPLEVATGIEAVEESIVGQLVADLGHTRASVEAVRDYREHMCIREEGQRPQNFGEGLATSCPASE